MDISDGIEGFIDLLALGIRRRKPTIEGSIPDFADLEAEVDEIWESRAQEVSGKIKEPQDDSNMREEGSASSKSISEGTACIPCVNDHLSTCAGLVSDESVRMARRNGIDDDEVVRRILRCSDQLNAMEREDLSVEKIAALPDWEKAIAVYAQNETADIRHKLNNITTADELESVALQIIESRDKIGKEWLRGRLKNMTPSEKAKVREKAEEILDKELNS